MGRFKEWRERNKEDLKGYEDEYKRLMKMRSELKPGTEEYAAIQNELSAVVAIEDKRREVKRKVPKEARSGIVKGLVSMGGFGLLVLGISRYEATGHIFGGADRKSVDSIVSTASRLIGFK